MVDSIWELNYNAMLIHLCKPSLQNQHEDGMVELTPTMCDDIRWGSNPKLLHVFICKAVRQLR